MPLDSYLPEKARGELERSALFAVPPSEIEHLHTFTKELEAECAGVYKALGKGEIISPLEGTRTGHSPERLFEDHEIIEKIDHAEIEVLNEVEAAVIAETREALRSLYESRQKLTELAAEPTSPEQEPAIRSLMDGLKRLAELRAEKAEHFFYPRIGFSADGGAIEGQWVEVLDIETDDKTHSKYQVNFKLTEEHLQELLTKIENGDLPAGVLQENGVIEFQPSNIGADPLPFSKAFQLSKNGISLSISKGVSSRKKNGKEAHIDQRCALGLVTAIIDKENATEAAVTLMNFIEELGVNNCFTEPTKEDQTRYKLARYTWHHKKSLDSLTPAEAKAIDQRLAHREVMDGYATYVEPDKHKEYERQAGKLCVYHELSIAPEEISKLLGSSGLLCSRKRYEGGRINYQGLSTQTDLETGGGDSIFTRIVTEAGLTSKPSHDYDVGFHTVLFKPSVLDRTDWYAYAEDSCGNTQPEFLETSLSPTTLFDKHAQGDFSPGNEQMFRHGISSKDMAAIMVNGDANNHLNAILLVADKGFTSIGEKNFDELIFMDREELIAHYKQHKAVLEMTDEQIETAIEEDIRDKIIAACKKDGILTVNGQPIQKFVRYGTKLSDQIEAIAQPDWHETSYIASWRELFNRTAKESADTLSLQSTDGLYA